MDEKKVLELKKYWISRLQLHLDTLQVVRDNLLDSDSALNNLEMCEKLNKVSEFLSSLPLWLDMLDMLEQKGTEQKGTKTS